MVSFSSRQTGFFWFLSLLCDSSRCQGKLSFQQHINLEQCGTAELRNCFTTNNAELLYYELPLHDNMPTAANTKPSEK